LKQLRLRQARGDKELEAAPRELAAHEESGGQTTVDRAALSPRWTKVRSRENTNWDSTTWLPQGTG